MAPHPARAQQFPFAFLRCLKPIGIFQWGVGVFQCMLKCLTCVCIGCVGIGSDSPRRCGLVEGFRFKAVPGAKYRLDFEAIAADLNRMALSGDYEGARVLIRDLGEADMFFFGYFVLGLEMLNHPWLVDRVYEVQDVHDRTLDLWPRGHYKSTIISLIKPLWTAARDPETRQAWFSHSRQQAKKFLARARDVMEKNVLLRHCWSHVFWMNPESESPKWTDEGLVLKRKGAYQQASFEAWGVVDKQPTGAHFTHLYFDDLVTENSVTSPLMIQKTARRFRLALNLVHEKHEIMITGTYYDSTDLYVTLASMNSWKKREWSATKDGTKDGEGWLLTRRELEMKYEDMGEYVFNTQILMNPVPEHSQTFKLEWLAGKFYESLPNVAAMNRYILVDPSGEDNKYTTDWTTMFVLGVDQWNNRWVLDIVRDRLELGQRYTTLRDLALRWTPVAIGYEKYSMQGDIPYIKAEMVRDRVAFPIPQAMMGNEPKPKRIRRLVPLFESGRIYFPRRLMYTMKNGETVDLVDEFLKNEYLKFPKPIHYDMMDCLARQMEDDPIRFTPFQVKVHKVYGSPAFDPFKTRKVKSSWRVW